VSIVGSRGAGFSGCKFSSICFMQFLSVCRTSLYCCDEGPNVFDVFCRLVDIYARLSIDSSCKVLHYLPVKGGH
jgi:hypothetical protein